MAQAYAAAREQEGPGEADVFSPAEAPRFRSYDGVVLISRSGTTSEVVQALQGLPAELPTVAVVGDPDPELAHRATHAVCLPFTDERSVVQTRFAMAALKMRESCQVWEYRHGPVAIAGPDRVTWQLGAAPSGLAEQVRGTGARFETCDRHPPAGLVRVVHAAALIRARRNGLDPDHPSSLSRSVVLNDETS